MGNADDLLLERAKQGDRHALDELLASHEAAVYRFGLRMCGSEEAAREVLQQTLLTAFQTLHSFRGDAQLSTWLFQIARSFCVKERRLRVGEPRDFVELDDAALRTMPTATPEDEAHARQLGEAIHAAVLALPPRHREVLILRDIEGLSANEAATVLGLDVANLKTRLFRARVEVRKHLQVLLAPRGEIAECVELAADLADLIGADVEKATCDRIEDHLTRCSSAPPGAR